MRLIARGYTYKELARRLDLSVKTVETHVSAVLRKLQLSQPPRAHPLGHRPPLDLGASRRLGCREPVSKGSISPCLVPSGADPSASGWSTSRSSSTPPCPARPCTSTSSTRAPAPASSTRRCPPPTAKRCRREAIVKGYELASGEYVTVGDDELARLDPEASRTIDIEEFVDLADIDPIFYDSRLLRGAGQGHGQALRAARPGHGGVGQGRHRPVRDALEAVPLRGAAARTASSCCRRWSTPTRSTTPAEIPELDDLEGIEVTKKELDMARQLIDSLSADFEPERFEDTYRSQVLDLIERKAAGQTEVVAPPVADGGGQGRRPHGRPRGEREVGQGGPQAPPGRRADGGGRRPKQARPRSAPASRRSRAVPVPEERTEQVVEIDGRRLKLSNLDKVLYPEAGFTKAEVIDYYVRIAPAMLPHIADRGVTLRRYPNGVDGQSFFEKRCPSHRPEWIGTFAGPGRPQRHDRVLRARLHRRAGVVGQHGRARDPRADGARRRHRGADDVRVRPRPRGAGRHPQLRRGGARHPRRARRPGRPRVRGQDVGVEGPAALRAAQPAAHPRALLVVRPGGGPGAGEAPRRPGHLGDGEGAPARQGVHRLEPEQPPQDDRRPCTRCGPGPGPRCRPR